MKRIIILPEVQNPLEMYLTIKRGDGSIERIDKLPDPREKFGFRISADLYSQKPKFLSLSSNEDWWAPLKKTVKNNITVMIFAGGEEDLLFLSNFLEKETGLPVSTEKFLEKTDSVLIVFHKKEDNEIEIILAEEVPATTANLVTK